MYSRKLTYLVVAALTLGACSAQAWQKGKKNKSGTVTIAPKGEDLNYRIILLPDFYHYEKKVASDTTFSYECSRNHHDVNVNAPGMIDSVDEIKYTMGYYMSSQAPGAGISRPFIMKTLCIFERTSPGTWSKLDKKTMQETYLKEKKDVIRRNDTVHITNPNTGTTEHIVHKYYETILDPMGQAEPGGHHH